MSGTSEYINAYIDIAVGNIHENINTILQLKTENILAKSIVASKDATILELERQLESSRSRDVEMDKLRQDAARWENECHAMRNKVDNLEGIVNQFNDLKHKYIEKEKELESLKSKNSNKKEKITVPSKVINTKNTVSLTVTTPDPNDDF